MQGIFLLQKNVSVIANYVQTVLCYSNIIKAVQFLQSPYTFAFTA